MAELMLAENWMSHSKRRNKELYSELDLLLRALDRFFNLEDFPPTNGQFLSKNFITELTAGRETITRVLSILERVIPEGKKNAYLFQKFAESKLLHGSRRNVYRKEMYKQDTPERSLYILYGSFLNMKSIMSDLRKNKFIEYMSFRNLGQIVSKEIRENVYFNPFRRDLDPELDSIGHKDISTIVKSMEQKEVRRIISITFLHLFRFLRYIDHVELDKLKPSVLLPSLIIIMLLHSEIDLFRTYMRRNVEKLRDRQLASTLESLSYQFTMESKRVYEQELRDIFDYGTMGQLRGMLENSHGILKNLIEHTIINLAQYWKPDIKGEDIFSDFITKTEQSLKLRENIYLLSKLLIKFEESSGKNVEEARRMLRVLKRYMHYFEKSTFVLLRHDDYSEFQSFFVESLAYEVSPDTFKQFMTRCQYFIVFLDTTLRHIDNRAELIDKPLDIKRTDDVLREFISSNK